MNSVFDKFFKSLIRVGTDIICRIDKDDFPKVPQHGPLILVINHIGSLEVPLLFTHLQPRRMIGLAKVETWDKPFMGWLFTMWEAIPVRRGEADMDAYRGCLEVLKKGDILAIAPEGTRSYNGRLLRAQPGVVMLALRSRAPILPIAHWGGEDFPENIKKARRTDFHVRVGNPFTLEITNEKVNASLRQEIADEIMGQIAALLPEQYHGVYSGKTTNCKHLQRV
jgi:1-acyl-sn-glycerol-3-phosphate acyltransferase